MKFLSGVVLFNLWVYFKVECLKFFNSFCLSIFSNCLLIVGYISFHICILKLFVFLLL